MLSLATWRPIALLQGTTLVPMTVAAGGTATTTFNVACSGLVADLAVANSSTGNAIPAGYDVVVDAGTPVNMLANDQVTFTDLGVGDHSVELQNVPANCTVAGDNPRTVSLPDGGLTETFDVACTGGDLDVTTSTWGTGLDGDGYEYAVDGGTPAAIGINDMATVTDLPTGDVSVQLTGLAANCSVQGDDPLTVTIVDGMTVTGDFEVFCFQTLSNDIVFESNRDGNGDVFAMTANGSEQAPLTRDAAEDGRPVSNVDGTSVIFESNRNGDYDLWKGRCERNQSAARVVGARKGPELRRGRLQDSLCASVRRQHLADLAGQHQRDDADAADCRSR